MVRCRIPGCTVKRAIFNYSGEIQGICCGKHKEDGMIDLFRLRCKQDDCMIQALFNFPNENKGLFCNQHKLEGMININKARVCEFEDCTKRPCFNYEK